MTPLQQLADAVEAGKMLRWQASTVWFAGSRDAKVDTVEAAHHGDINAAVRLVEALLPGPHSETFVTLGLGGGAIIHGSNDGKRPDVEAAIFGSNPARALLLAVLRAKIAEEGQ